MQLPAPDRWLLLALVTTLAAAIALSAAVSIAQTPLAGETRTIREVQGWAFPGRPLSDFLRATTTTGMVLLLGTLFAIGLFVLGERREALVLLALLFALSWLQPAIKELVERPRPDPAIFDRRGDATSPSFPSGHVMSPTVLFGYMIALCATTSWPRVARLLGACACGALLLLGGLVNVWIAVHWPTDVIGGYLWGGSLVLVGVLVSRWIARRLEQHERER